MPENVEPKQKNTGMAVVAYLIFFVPLLTEAKDDPFVKFHVKQGLILFLAWIVLTIFSMVPVIGWVLGPILSLGLLILMVIGILNAVNGETKELPLIGQYASKINL
jgi:uncharacterized membrane protein